MLKYKAFTIDFLCIQTLRPTLHSLAKRSLGNLGSVSLVQFVDLLRAEFFQSFNAMSFSKFLNLQQLLLVASLDKLLISLLTIHVLGETSRSSLVCTYSVETAVLHASIEFLLHQIVEIVKSVLSLFFASQDPIHH